ADLLGAMPDWLENPEGPSEPVNRAARAGTSDPVVQGPPPTVPPPTPPPDPYAVDATMRLIPVPNFGAPSSAPAPTPAPASQASATERRIGKYIVKRELGRGGMGTVYL